MEKEETDWSVAAKTGTEQVLLKFVQDHPDGKHADQAKATIAALRPCKATGGGDIGFVASSYANRLKADAGIKGELVGVVIECKAGAGCAHFTSQ